MQNVSKLEACAGCSEERATSAGGAKTVVRGVDAPSLHASKISNFKFDSFSEINSKATRLIFGDYIVDTYASEGLR